MEEDVLGTREEAIGDRYVTCNSCGRVFPREQATLTSDEEVEDAKSEQAEICPDCRRKARSGDESPT